MDTDAYTISCFVPAVLSHLLPLETQKRAPKWCSVLSHAGVRLSRHKLECQVSKYTSCFAQFNALLMAWCMS